MKKSRLTEEQIAYVLRLAESVTIITDVCRQMDIVGATFVAAISSGGEQDQGYVLH